jgi:hypothetical protein
VYAVSSSSFGSTLNSRSVEFATKFNSQMNGLTSFTHATWIGTSHSARRSGSAIARFFGTISPIKTCRIVMKASAIANEIGCSRTSGSPTSSKKPASWCAIAGSPRRPSSSEQIVMPSWAPASISETFLLALMTIFARALPCSSNASSRSRRDEIRLNSAPTKNAFASSRTTTRKM